MTPEPAQPAESPEARALEPCPFCGAGQAVDAEDFSGVWLEKTDHDEPEYHVHCWWCGGRGNERSASEDAIAAWNTRAASTARPTERGAVEVARNLIASMGKAMGEHFDSNYVSAWTPLIVEALALPATDQAAEVENLRSELQSVVEAATGPNGWDWIFPLRVNPVDGKPTIVSHKGGNLFRGYIGTWKEADLMVALANAAPRILAALATQLATGRTMGGEVERHLREAQAFLGTARQPIPDQASARREIDAAIEALGRQGGA